MEKNICDFSFDELEVKLIEAGFKKYNAKQIWDWMYNKKVLNIDEMTNLNKKLKAYIANNFIFKSMDLVVKKELNSKTIKYLFETKDNQYIETVLMKHNYGNTVCISSQIGCNIGCKFCASTVGGCSRNLTVSEMVEQVNLIELDGNKIRNIVVMGMGEPLLNLDNLIKFIKIANNQAGLNVGARHITISTSGIVPAIKKLAEVDLQYRLAISLHAANDNLRDELVPINKKYSIKELLNVCKYYQEKSNRRLMFEYILIQGVNDTKEDAKELANLIKDFNAVVNLIPINAIPEVNYQRPSKEKIIQFADVLKKHFINTTIRQEFGTDIDAACGQLRNRKKGV